MGTEPYFRAIDRVAAHLPFALDDIEQVNAVYARWHRRGVEADARDLAVWTYCYVRRYFLMKCVRHGLTADFEALIEQTYQKIEAGRSQLADAGCYAQWVSVVCKHTFVNHLRDRVATVSLGGEKGPVPRTPPPAYAHDPGLVLAGVRQAVGRLPEYLQEAARMRLIERRSYEDIAECIGKPVPTARAYAHKAARQLRDDPHLLAFLAEVVEEFSS